MSCFKFIKNLQAAVFLGGGPQSLPIQTSLEMENVQRKQPKNISEPEMICNS